MYGFSKAMDCGFDAAVVRVRDALQKEGFGVLTEIDVKETLKKKLDVDFRKYVILGACNPPYAHRALTAELEIGLLMPCNVIVYENDEGGSTVSAVDASLMAKVTANEELSRVSDDVNKKLQRVIDAL
ncbi:MAG: DUF302 domain-containing protein [Candidatus Latescibacterota bacterium]|nr:MAG: DUF302 domain-containing protein [Candidatus Latescibacterota bacterium]